jgi:hypothetical protein
MVVPEAYNRTALLERINAIVAAGYTPAPGERERLARLQKLLSVRSVQASVMSPVAKTSTRQPRQAVGQETQVTFAPSRTARRRLGGGVVFFPGGGCEGAVKRSFHISPKEGMVSLDQTVPER